MEDFKIIDRHCECDDNLEIHNYINAYYHNQALKVYVEKIKVSNNYREDNSIGEKITENYFETEYAILKNPYHSKNDNSFINYMGDAVQCVKDGYVDIIDINENNEFSSARVLRILDRNIGEFFRKKTLEKWADAKFGYIFSVYPHNYELYLFGKDGDWYREFNDRNAKGDRIEQALLTEYEAIKAMTAFIQTSIEIIEMYPNMLDRLLFDPYESTLKEINQDLMNIRNNVGYLKPIIKDIVCHLVCSLSDSKTIDEIVYPVQVLLDKDGSLFLLDQKNYY